MTAAREGDTGNFQLTHGVNLEIAFGAGEPVEGEPLIPALRTLIERARGRRAVGGAAPRQYDTSRYSTPQSRRRARTGSVKSYLDSPGCYLRRVLD